MPDNDSRLLWQRITEIADRWSRGGEDLAQLTELEAELMALHRFNSEYGANGLSSYFSWHQFEFVPHTVAALRRIGADRLCDLFSELVSALQRGGWPASGQDFESVLASLPASVRPDVEAIDVAASELYTDFFERFERTFVPLFIHNGDGQAERRA